MNSSEGIEAMLAELSVLYDSKSSSRDSETLGVDENSHKVRTPRDNAVINADALRVSRESDDPRVTPDLVQCFIDENNLVNQLCEVRAPATLFLEPPKGKRNKSYKRLLFDRFVMFDPSAELLKKLRFSRHGISVHGKPYLSTRRNYNFTFRRLSSLENKVEVVDVSVPKTIYEISEGPCYKEPWPYREDYLPDPDISDGYDDLEALELNTRGDGCW